MDRTEIENLLISKGVKPTANRILVADRLINSRHPLSLADLEDALMPMDKSSIFRVLETFSDKDIVHVIEDGSRSLKYEICHGAENHSVSDQHAHFYCEKCGSVFCLDDVKLDNIEIPKEYNVRSVNLMFKGTCPSCEQ